MPRGARNYEKIFNGDMQNYYQIPAINSNKAIGVHTRSGEAVT